jgi:hypothetical protein
MPSLAPSVLRTLNGRSAACPSPSGRGDPRGGPAPGGDDLGRLTHEAIYLYVGHARRLCDGHTEAITRALGDANTRSPALRARITAMVCAYAWRFDPRPRAVLLGCELRTPSARFDLVWQSGDRIWADELKTSLRPDAVALRAQLRRELAAGKRRWGDRFRGVRLVPLALERDALWFSSAGVSMVPP